MTDDRLLLVGCGNMGRAILDAWLAGSLAGIEITVVDPVLAEAPRGVRLLPQVPAGERFSAVVLAVKPQLLDAVAPQVAGAADGALLLSILAGVPLARLEATFRGATPVRFMANLAAAFGASPVAAFAGSLPPQATALAGRLLNPLGPLTWLAAEEQLHAVTALAGSGPGFVYRFLDALSRGGVELGLDPAAAAQMALAMVAGAAELAARSPDAFATLAAKVASKGGTTEAGMAVLDADRALDRLIAGTLTAACGRSRELAGEG
ncbi:MAG: pyrroline-5-carboxylate reductase dimerization domain-containing protein [Novosphingobium sp.]